MQVGNLYENVTGSDLVELFGLKTTNYLVDNCCIEMSNLQQNGTHNAMHLSQHIVIFVMFL